MHERRLPETINVNIASPGTEQLRTDISGLGMTFVAGFRAINAKLDLILKGLSSGLTAEQIEQLKRITAKVEAIDKKETE